MLKSSFDGIEEKCIPWKEGERGIVHFPLFPVTQELEDSLNCAFKSNKMKHFPNITENLIMSFVVSYNEIQRKLMSL